MRPDKSYRCFLQCHPCTSSALERRKGDICLFNDALLTLHGQWEEQGGGGGGGVLPAGAKYIKGPLLVYLQIEITAHVKVAPLVPCREGTNKPGWGIS